MDGIDFELELDDLDTAETEAEDPETAAADAGAGDQLGGDLGIDFNPDAEEEERRLFYVAITRAEQRVYLSYALNRYRFGRLKNCEPSRFLEEKCNVCSNFV